MNGGNNGNDKYVKQLMGMGFEADHAEEALRITAGNIENAVSYLLNGGIEDDMQPSAANVTDAVPTPSSVSSSKPIVGPISQYSVEDGRSACTCIALTAATKFLTSKCVDADFLRSMITEGVQTYNSLSTSVEHMSAEEILSQDHPFPLRCDDIRQGMLSHDPEHFIGLHVQLHAVRQEHDAWMAVLLTKTPETVLLCLPPRGGSFWLVDSHPRAQLGCDGAYAKEHASMAELIATLQMIFPPTDLGPDIPEMMATMYNSFDLYPLSLTSSSSSR
eukprot:CAMPEP_0198119390 /NCGR_PEP_ID=MMETSP1442-20131203/25417_1 /TAXON_ID= /ORGANISM="Craspedostauros australis, Strain CCMP3328" /LENGTH=274 /DNA_ID=CAMNT_0043777843 /DNA_START=6 /DNA_END=830 /DNA_ORIENTATION=+